MSLRGVGRFRVTTPLQHRCTSPQKEETTGIHLYVSGLHLSVISTPYLSLVSYLFTYLLVTCRKFSSSCTSSEFTLCQAIKVKKIKNYLSAYSPPLPLVTRIGPFTPKFLNPGSAHGSYTTQYKKK
jgi:hypothetical protein